MMLTMHSTSLRLLIMMPLLGRLPKAPSITKLALILRKLTHSFAAACLLRNKQSNFNLGSIKLMSKDKGKVLGKISRFPYSTA